MAVKERHSILLNMVSITSNTYSWATPLGVSGYSKRSFFWVFTERTKLWSSWSNSSVLKCHLFHLFCNCRCSCLCITFFLIENFRRFWWLGEWIWKFLALFHLLLFSLLTADKFAFVAAASGSVRVENILDGTGLSIARHWALFRSGFKGGHIVLRNIYRSFQLTWALLYRSKWLSAVLEDSVAALCAPSFEFAVEADRKSLIETHWWEVNTRIEPHTTNHGLIWAEDARAVFYSALAWCAFSSCRAEDWSSSS